MKSAKEWNATGRVSEREEDIEAIQYDALESAMSEIDLEEQASPDHSPETVSALRSAVQRVRALKPKVQP